MPKPVLALDGQTTSPSPIQGKLTMAEAAKIKGVSYHTVSRAVRRGRLRAERLGRMALIAADDLDVWEPMRERAPKRYRDRLPTPETVKWIERFDATSGADLVISLGESFRGLQTATVDRPVHDVANVIASLVAQFLGLRRVSLWAPRSQGTWSRVARVGDAMSRVPDTLDASALSKPEFDVGKVRVIADVAPSVRDLGFQVDSDHAGPILAIPLVFNGTLLAWLFGDSNGEPLEITPRQLDIVDALAADLAFVLDCSFRREQHADVLALYEQTLSGSRDDLELRNESNEPISTNLSQHSIFAGTWTWKDSVTGEPVTSADPAFSEVKRTGKAVSGTLIGANSAGDQRMVDVCTEPLTRNGRVIGYARRVADQVVNPARTQVLQEEMRRFREVQDRTHAINSVMPKIADQNAPNDVVTCVVQTLVERLGAFGGVGLLRDIEGQMVVVSEVNRNPSERLGHSYNPILVPSLILAISQRRALIVRRSDAAVAEQSSLEAQGAKSVIIVPIQNGETTLGAVALLYEQEDPENNPDLEFATEIGKRCTRIIEHLRAIEESVAVAGRVHRVLNQLPQAVIVFSYPAVRVEIANGAATALLQRDIVDDRLGIDDLALIDSRGQRLERERHPVMRAMISGQSTLGEPVTLVREDRSQVPVLANHSPLFDERGAMTGVLCEFQNRSDFKPLDEAKDEFLSVVAHELRNPLTSLRGNLQLMQRRLRKREQEGFVLEEFARIGTVIDQADRISELVGRLLDVSRVDLGKLDLSLAETDASVLVQSMVDSSLGIAANRDVRVTAPERLDVVWDQVRVEQVLSNLLSNAIKYTEAGPIDVALIDVDESTVQITVRDHGDGVPDSMKPRLFKQYFRLEHESNEQGQNSVHGLGIGLYLSARYAQVHGGELTVEDAPGGGALFRLTMPRVAEQSADGDPLLVVYSGVQK